MRKLLYFILLLPYFASAQQTGIPPGVLQGQTSTRIVGSGNSADRVMYYGNNKWDFFLTYITPNLFPLVVTKSTVTVGTTYNTIDDFFKDISQSQPPLVTFTPSTINNELTSSSTGTSTLSFTYAKQTGTNNFTEIRIDGNGATIYPGFIVGGGSGSQNVTYPSNTSTTYTFTATTSGGKFASANSTINYLPRRYSGRAAGTTPTTAEILATAGGTSTLSSSKAGTFTITASGTNYPFFAYPSSQGTLTSIKDANNVEVLSGYNTGTLSLTNASGFTQTYRYYINQNATAGNTTMVTQ